MPPFGKLFGVGARHKCNKTLSLETQQQILNGTKSSSWEQKLGFRQNKEFLGPDDEYRE